MIPISKLWLFIVVLIIYCVCLSRVAQAKTFGNFHVLDVNEFSLDYAKILNHDDPYYPYQDPVGATRESWANESAVHFKLDLFAYKKWSLFYDADVLGYTTNDRYREVELHWRGGFDFNRYAQVWFDHDSQHLLDASSSNHFPLYNSFGCSIVLYNRDRDYGSTTHSH